MRRAGWWWRKLRTPCKVLSKPMAKRGRRVESLHEKFILKFLFKKKRN